MRFVQAAQEWAYDYRKLQTLAFMNRDDLRFTFVGSQSGLPVLAIGYVLFRMLMSQFDKWEGEVSLEVPRFAAIRLVDRDRCRAVLLRIL